LLTTALPFCGFQIADAYQAQATAQSAGKGGKEGEYGFW